MGWMDWLAILMWGLVGANVVVLVRNYRTFKDIQRIGREIAQRSDEVIDTINVTIALRRALNIIVVKIASDDRNIYWRMWAHEAARSWDEMAEEETPASSPSSSTEALRPEPPSR